MNDRQLSPHVTFFDLTKTTHADLQEENRHTSQEEDVKLLEVANLAEAIITLLGCDLDFHSGRRYLALNKRVGGSERSQHLKCEALDWSPKGPDTEETVTAAWQKVATAARNGKIAVGQLLLESESQAREGRVWWVHVSLGAPYRNAARCGEIATLIDGKFTLIAKIG